MRCKSKINAALVEKNQITLVLSVLISKKANKIGSIQGKPRYTEKNYIWVIFPILYFIWGKFLQYTVKLHLAQQYSKYLKVYKSSELSGLCPDQELSSSGSCRTTKFLCIVFLQSGMRLMKIHYGNNKWNDDLSCPPLPFILTEGYFVMRRADEIRISPLDSKSLNKLMPSTFFLFYILLLQAT